MSANNHVSPNLNCLDSQSNPGLLELHAGTLDYMASLDEPCIVKGCAGRLVHRAIVTSAFEYRNGRLKNGEDEIAEQWVCCDQCELLVERAESASEPALIAKLRETSFPITRESWSPEDWQSEGWQSASE